MDKFIRNWGPAIVWMCFIFFLSSRRHITVSEEYVVNFLIFKTLHVIEYATLNFLVFRAVFLSQKKKNLEKSIKQAAIIAVLYACSDEIHQLFVPTREGTVRDVLIDTIGISLVFWFIKNHFKRIKQFIV